MIPSVSQVVAAYQESAKLERVKSGRPGVRTARNAVNGTKIVVKMAAKVLERAESEVLELPFSAIDRRLLDKALLRLVEGGVKRLTAWSYVCQFRAIAARWTLGYYEDRGWSIQTPQLPHFPVRGQRYERPSPDLLDRVKAWYAGLKGRERFAATMMLEFGMRNGDIMRLKSNNLVWRGERWYLSYTPHKTQLSSGRRVMWPVCASLLALVREGCERGVKAGVFERLNRQLRALGFKGSKACYELRKICIDHVYQKYGAEMATSLSGDDIRTISRYYADPAQPNLGETRVVDLL